MIKLFLALNVFGESLLKDYDGKDATFEILVMLLGAFALGFLLRHLIGFRKKEYIIEQANLNEGENSGTESGDFSSQINRLKIEIDRLSGLKSNSVNTALKNSEKLGLSTSSDSNLKEETAIQSIEKQTPKKETAKGKTIDPKSVKSLGSNTDKSDLKVIEGIGPALEKMLNENQIYSYDQLANKKVSELEDLLDKAGPRFRVHVPETWPEQASLLRDGKIEAFKALTERLKGGRRV